MKKRFLLSLPVICLLHACSGGGESPKQGNDLSGDDAKTMLAGEEGKAWKLVGGHSIYDNILFAADGHAVVFAMDPPVPYSIDGKQLTFTEETGYKARFTIQQISNDTLILLRVVDTAESDEVIEPLTYMNLQTFRSKGMKQEEDFFLKGKTGTVWASREDKTKRFSFMNDGKLLLGANEAGKWSLDKNADQSQKMYPVEILASDYIKLQWGDTLLDLHYAGQAK